MFLSFLNKIEESVYTGEINFKKAQTKLISFLRLMIKNKNIFCLKGN